MSHDAIEERLAQVPLFANLSKKQIKHISTLATTVEISPGRVLAAQGETGREFVIVLAGEAEVTRDGEVVAKRSSGDFFGEISLLLDRPRTASVVALTPMTVDVIEVRQFKSMLQDNPALYEPLLRAISQRIVLQDDHNFA
jgi:CRP-like cAMP-binding protein